MSKSTAPLSPKVPGAVGGGAAGAFVSWVLGVFAFGAPMDASHATDAIAAVPWPILGIVVAGLTALGGYIPRDLASTLFEGQQAEDTSVYGNVMGAQAPVAVELEDDTDDGTADEPDET